MNHFRFLFYPFLIVFGLGFLLYLSPIHFVQDYFNIYHYQKIHEIFSLIVGSLVSLIGIYVSVTIVAYEFFRQKSGVDFQKSFSINPKSAYYISFTVLTILFSFVSGITISISSPSDAELTIIYYNIILFCLIILSLIPISLHQFTSLRAEKFVKQELEKVNDKTIFIRASNDIDEQSNIIEQDPLLRIENIIISMIQVNEHLKARSLILKVTKKLIGIITSCEYSDDKDYVTDRTISFVMSLVDSVLAQSNNSLLLKGVWEVSEQAYIEITNRRLYSTELKRFRSVFFERYFSRLFKANHDELIFHGIESLGSIIQDQILENMPEDDCIYYLDHLRSSIDKDFKYPRDRSESDYKISDHWIEISLEFMGIYSFVINRGISLKMPEIINKCFREIQELNFKFHLEKIGLAKESFFLINSADIISDFAYRAFEKDVFMEGSEAKNLLPALYDDLITREHPVARTLLQKYCYFLINLQRNEKLDRWFLGGLTIGDFLTLQGTLGDIAFRCSVEYNKGETARLCLVDCIDTFKIFKEEFERRPPTDYGLYLSVKSRFESILKWINQREIENKELINKLDTLIISFKEEQVLRKTDS